MSVITYKFRIKDRTSRKRLAAHAIACNQVWNYCVATQRETESRRKAGLPVRWLSHFGFNRLTSGGCAEELGIHSYTVDRVCARFVASRNAAKKCPRFRASFGSKRALGFVPFKARSIRIDGDALTYLGKRYRFWRSRDIEGECKTGAFVEDARGRWYVTFQCEVESNLSSGGASVGIDLGLATLATLSNGARIPAQRHYRKYEAALAVAQRAGKKARARALHAKITNCRRHHLHVASTKIANEFGLIVVGNVNAASMARTKMAKSVLDAGWSAFRYMLQYKCARRQAVYIEADEAWTSRTCSCCGSIPDSSPKGKGALGVRRWECADCGAAHDRDVNAAINILRVGLECQPPLTGTVAK